MEIVHIVVHIIEIDEIHIVVGAVEDSVQEEWFGDEVSVVELGERGKGDDVGKVGVEVRVEESPVGIPSAHHAPDVVGPLEGVRQVSEMCEVDFQVWEVVENVFPEHGVVETFGVFEDTVSSEEILIVEVPYFVDLLKSAIEIDMSFDVQFVSQCGHTASGDVRDDGYVVFLTIVVQGHQHGVSGRVTAGRIEFETDESAPVDAQFARERFDVVGTVILYGKVGGTPRVHGVEREDIVWVREREFGQLLFLLREVVDRGIDERQISESLLADESVERRGDASELDGDSPLFESGVASSSDMLEGGADVVEFGVDSGEHVGLSDIGFLVLRALCEPVNIKHEWCEDEPFLIGGQFLENSFGRLHGGHEEGQRAASIARQLSCLSVVALGGVFS